VEDNDIIIVAGGKGSRPYPLTLARLKPTGFFMVNCLWNRINIIDRTQFFMKNFYQYVRQCTEELPICLSKESFMFRSLKFFIHSIAKTIKEIGLLI
jgi:hypothetical protein